MLSCCGSACCTRSGDTPPADTASRAATTFATLPTRWPFSRHRCSRNSPWHQRAKVCRLRFRLRDFVFVMREMRSMPPHASRCFAEDSWPSRSIRVPPRAPWSPRRVHDAPVLSSSPRVLFHKASPRVFLRVFVLCHARAGPTSRFSSCDSCPYVGNDQSRIHRTVARQVRDIVGNEALHQRNHFRNVVPWPWDTLPHLQCEGSAGRYETTR